MKLDKKRAKCALKVTVIATLIVVLFEVGGMVCLMTKYDLSFMEARPDSWMFSVKGVLTHIGGLIFFFFWVYFLESEKE